MKVSVDIPEKVYRLFQDYVICIGCEVSELIQQELKMSARFLLEELARIRATDRERLLDKYGFANDQILECT